MPIMNANRRCRLSLIKSSKHPALRRLEGLHLDVLDLIKDYGDRRLEVSLLDRKA